MRRLLGLIHWRFFRGYLLRILVDDRVVLPYLYVLARCVILARRPLIIAITGSVGKTTTTGQIAAVLSQPEAQDVLGGVRSTVDNMNNDVGVPLTILLQDRWLSSDGPERLRSLGKLTVRALALVTFARYPRVLVLECAAGLHGHVHRSVRLAPPKIGIVTSIGPTHLERFHTVEGVMREKSAVVKAVPSSGLVVLGEGHDFVQDLERLARAPVVRVSGRGLDLSRNIACVVARHLGLSEKTISTALSAFTPPKARLNRLALGDWLVIDDTYNANPLSMRLGLDVLSEAARPGHRRVAILGQMAELGQQAAKYHRDIGQYAHSHSDLVVGVGELGKAYDPDYWFATSTECATAVPDLLRDGDCILVKGSASLKMGDVVTALHKVVRS